MRRSRNANSKASMATWPVNQNLTLSVKQVSGLFGLQRESCLVNGAADLTRGGGSYACPRSGCLLACPLQPDTSRREGSLVKSAVAMVRLESLCGPADLPLFFAPADRRWARPAWSSSGGPGVAAVFGGACGPAGRLEDVQKGLTALCRGSSGP